MKKVRAAAVIAVVTTAVSQARDYAREHPDQAAQTVDQVERFLRGRPAPQHGAYLDKGIAALRQGLGLPPRAARRPARRGRIGRPPGSPTPTRTPPNRLRARLPRPGGPQPLAGHQRRPPAAPVDDDPAPLTPGERPHH